MWRGGQDARGAGWEEGEVEREGCFVGGELCV